MQQFLQGHMAVQKHVHEIENTRIFLISWNFTSIFELQNDKIFTI